MLKKYSYPWQALLLGIIEVSRGKHRHAGTYRAYRDIPVMTGRTGGYIYGHTGEYRGTINTGFGEILKIIQVHLGNFKEKEIQGNNLDVREYRGILGKLGNNREEREHTGEYLHKQE